MTQRSRLLGVLLLAAIFVVVLPAQSTNQSIQGLVTDTSGAVVPGAKVTITNTATGVSMSATTNDTGNYTIQLIPVGNYAAGIGVPAPVTVPKTPSTCR